MNRGFELTCTVLQGLPAFGFIEGVIVGLISSVLIFVVRYSRINMVKIELSGANYQSNVERSPMYRKLLRMKGEQICIYKLQGYIFFGTANNLVERIRKRIADADRLALQFLLLDFSLVTGMDSSAMNSIKKMSQITENANIKVILTQLSDSIGKQFDKEGYVNDSAFKFFPDMDHGVEWCEDQLLVSLEDSGRTGEKDLLDAHGYGFWEFAIEETLKYLETQEAFDALIQKMEKYLIQQSAPKNTVLISQGETPDGIWLIQSGEVIVQLENQDGSRTRLQKIKTGAIVGEIAFYTHSRAKATVITQTKCDGLIAD